MRGIQQHVVLGAMFVTVSGCGDVVKRSDVDASLGDGGGSGSFARSAELGPDRCGRDCIAFPEHAVVLLVATPAEGSTFVGWAGDCRGPGTCAVTMDRARAVSGLFVRDRSAAPSVDAEVRARETALAAGLQPLFVTTAGDGLGRVTSQLRDERNE